MGIAKQTTWISSRVTRDAFKSDDIFFILNEIIGRKMTKYDVYFVALNKIAKWIDRSLILPDFSVVQTVFRDYGVIALIYC